MQNVGMDINFYTPTIECSDRPIYKGVLSQSIDSELFKLNQFSGPTSSKTICYNQEFEVKHLPFMHSEFVVQENTKNEVQRKIYEFLVDQIPLDKSFIRDFDADEDLTLIDEYLEEQLLIEGQFVCKENKSCLSSNGSDALEEDPKPSSSTGELAYDSLSTRPNKTHSPKYNLRNKQYYFSELGFVKKYILEASTFRYSPSGPESIKNKLKLLSQSNVESLVKKQIKSRHSTPVKRQKVKVTHSVPDIVVNDIPKLEQGLNFSLEDTQSAIKRNKGKRMKRNKGKQPKKEEKIVKESHSESGKECIPGKRKRVEEHEIETKKEEIAKASQNENDKEYSLGERSKLDNKEVNGEHETGRYIDNLSTNAHNRKKMPIGNLPKGERTNPKQRSGRSRRNSASNGRSERSSGRLKALEELKHGSQMEAPQINETGIDQDAVVKKVEQFFCEAIARYSCGVENGKRLLADIKQEDNEFIVENYSNTSKRDCVLAETGGFVDGNGRHEYLDTAMAETGKFEDGNVKSEYVNTVMAETGGFVDGNGRSECLDTVMAEIGKFGDGNDKNEIRNTVMAETGKSVDGHDSSEVRGTVMEEVMQEPIGLSSEIEAECSFDSKVIQVTSKDVHEADKNNRIGSLLADCVIKLENNVRESKYECELRDVCKTKRTKSDEKLSKNVKVTLGGNAFCELRDVCRTKRSQSDEKHPKKVKVTHGGSAAACGVMVESKTVPLEIKQKVKSIFQNSEMDNMCGRYEDGIITQGAIDSERVFNLGESMKKQKKKRKTKKEIRRNERSVRNAIKEERKANKIVIKLKPKIESFCISEKMTYSETKQQRIKKTKRSKTKTSITEGQISEPKGVLMSNILETETKHSKRRTKNSKTECWNMSNFLESEVGLRANASKPQNSKTKTKNVKSECWNRSNVLETQLGLRTNTSKTTNSKTKAKNVKSGLPKMQNSLGTQTGKNVDDSKTQIKPRKTKNRKCKKRSSGSPKMKLREIVSAKIRKEKKKSKTKKLKKHLPTFESTLDSNQAPKKKREIKMKNKIKRCTGIGTKMSTGTGACDKSVPVDQAKHFSSETTNKSNKKGYIGSGKVTITGTGTVTITGTGTCDGSVRINQTQKKSKKKRGTATCDGNVPVHPQFIERETSRSLVKLPVDKVCPKLIGNLYHCNGCSYTSTQLSQMNIHINRHIGFRPFQCNHCQYSSVDLSHLRRHSMLHSGRRPHKCRLCPYAAIQKISLNRHMLNNHYIWE